MKKIVKYFDVLEPTLLPSFFGDNFYYKKSDFTEQSVLDMRQQFKSGLVERYLREREVRCNNVPIATNPLLRSLGI